MSKSRCSECSTRIIPNTDDVFQRTGICADCFEPFEQEEAQAVVERIAERLQE